MRNHLADSFVAWHGAGPMWCEVTLGEVEVRAAHPARRYSDENFAGPGRRVRPLAGSKGRGVDGSGVFDPPGKHGADHRTGATMQS